MEIKIFEAFSGIGAQHKALSNLKDRKVIKKFEVIGTSDWDIYAALSYASIHYPNFYKTKVKNNEINITNFSKNGKETIKNINYLKQKESKLIFSALKRTNNIGSIVDSFDRIAPFLKQTNLLTYSFPCTDLSTAGNFYGFNEGITKTTRSGLLFEIENILEKASLPFEKDRVSVNNNLERERERERERELKKLNLKKDPHLLPQFLLLENVPNLVSKQHNHQFKRWLAKLKDFGYSTNWGVINSHDFGMLQLRKRVYAFSWLSNNPKITESLEQDLKKLYDLEFKPKWIQKKLYKILDFDNLYKDEANWVQVKKTPSRLLMIEKGKTFSRESSNIISTVTTKQDRFPNLGFVDFLNDRTDKKGIPYTNKRLISPLETYMLMGFKKSEYSRAKKYLFKIIEKPRTEAFVREKLYKQAGNSIMVNVLEMIFYYMIKKNKGIEE